LGYKDSTKPRRTPFPLASLLEVLPVAAVVVQAFILLALAGSTFKPKKGF
jgi:hypothetical protein